MYEEEGSFNLGALPAYSAKNLAESMKDRRKALIAAQGIIHTRTYTYQPVPPTEYDKKFVGHQYFDKGKPSLLSLTHLYLKQL